jgi:phage RecT family recombinase
MATAEKTKQTQYKEPENQQSDTPNLDNAITATFKRITSALEKRESSIEELLPDFMKGQGKRLIARARQYWARGSFQLQQCTEASFIGCVLAAAELGFAIDGRMCHAVPFNTKVKLPGGGEKWENKAQLIVDYKGLIAVAKRHGLVQDVWARVVYVSDTFEFFEKDGEQHYTHAPNLEISRDGLKDAKGVLSIATHKNGWIRADFMPIVDVLAIRNRSKGYKVEKPSGPWHTDPGEMSKKTGIKRLLKTFSDDPGLLRALEIDNDADNDTDTQEARSVMVDPLAFAKQAPVTSSQMEVEQELEPNPFHPSQDPTGAHADIEAKSEPDQSKEAFEPQQPRTVDSEEANAQEQQEVSDWIDALPAVTTQLAIAQAIKDMPTSWNEGNRKRATDKANERLAEIRGSRVVKSNQKELV